ncbi:hypothetical protein BCR42DRAFT_411455 [Absidia repens]|uniref:Uncharacterized protein n=1 Tax=Absidia repens TaxID=90262 RepID=A0A1X2IN79_9FUNG|nr:hypothetical protein BCR42DRAFT_411455 [Absidia repens]
MTQNSYARISDSLLDIFNATEIGTATTLRDDDLSTYIETPFGDFDAYNNINIANDTESLVEDDDPSEQQQFNRISGILSQLIREANKAINSTSSSLSDKLTVMNENTGNKSLMTRSMDSKSPLHAEKSTTALERIISAPSPTIINTSRMSSTATIIDTLDNCDSPQQLNSVDDVAAVTKDPRRRSRLPRRKKLPLESFAQHNQDHQHQHYLHRNRSPSNASSIVSSTTSTPNLDEDSLLFSPVASSLTTPMSRTISPLFLEKEHYHHSDSNNNNNSSSNSSDYDSHVEKDSNGKHRPQLDGSTLSLTDSFERLDSSLAKVDTLSRDLASYRRKHPRSGNSKASATAGAAVQPAPVPPPSSTFISPDNNISANHHHYQQLKTKYHSNGWTVLWMLPLLYIPYLLGVALWEKWAMAASVGTTTPLDLLSTTISALVYGDSPRALVSSSTATQIIPLSVGLSVYALFLMILRLLVAPKPSISSTLEK